MNIAILIVAFFSVVTCFAANAAPALTLDDLKHASELQIQAFHAGNLQGVTPATKTYAPPAPVFDLLAAARPEDDPPFTPLEILGHATLVINDTAYRIVIPLSSAEGKRVYFSVAPETEPKRKTFFSLPYEQGSRLAKYFEPPQ